MNGYQITAVTLLNVLGWMVASYFLIFGTLFITEPLRVNPITLGNVIITMGIIHFASPVILMGIKRGFVVAIAGFNLCLLLPLIVLIEFGVYLLSLIACVLWLISAFLQVQVQMRHRVVPGSEERQNKSA